MVSDWVLPSHDSFLYPVLRADALWVPVVRGWGLLGAGLFSVSATDYHQNEYLGSSSLGCSPTPESVQPGSHLRLAILRDRMGEAGPPVRGSRVRRGSVHLGLSHRKLAREGEAGCHSAPGSEIMLQSMSRLACKWA